MTAPLPSGLAAVLPRDTARCWMALRGHLLPGLVLYGGTAIATHLHHRTSRDLDFFFTDPALDLAVQRRTLESLRPFAAITHTADTLNGVLGSTKIQFLLAAGQATLEPPTSMAGILVAGLRDLTATKIKFVGDCGELRDYFDLMTIERRAGIRIEEALSDYQERYRTRDPNTLWHLVRALGSFADVADDPTLPATRQEIEDYWRRRQPEIAESLDTTGRVVGPAHAAPQPRATSDGSPDGPDTGLVWVADHERNGRQVRGYWRRR